MEFKVGEKVFWHNIQCTIHHFGEYGFETIAYLDGIQNEERTDYGSWQRARLNELQKIGSNL